MLIAYDAKRAYHNHRGLGNYSRDLIRLMTIYAPQNTYLLFNPQQKNSIQLPFAEHIEQITPNHLWKLMPSLWRSYGCLHDLNKFQPDIYHGLSGELPYFIERLKFRKIVTIHDAIFMRYPEHYSTTYRHLFLQKCLYACSAADTIVAISEQTKRDCITYFGADERKIRVIYQGCNNQFRTIIDQQERLKIKLKYDLPDHYILYVGATEPNKNIEGIIRAMNIAKTDMPLVVVCNLTKHINRLADLAFKLHVAVKFMPNTPFSDFPAIYQQAECFAFMSFFEGFGIPVLEAVCSHIPILAASGSCLEETGGKAALYAQPDNIDDIADKLDIILTDQTIRQQLIEASFDQANKFSDPTIAQNLINLYQESMTYSTE